MSKRQRIVSYQQMSSAFGPFLSQAQGGVSLTFAA